MGDIITTELATFDTSLEGVATSALVAASAGLLVWVGWRLACKLLNRGVGK